MPMRSISSSTSGLMTGKALSELKAKVRASGAPLVLMTIVRRMLSTFTVAVAGWPARA